MTEGVETLLGSPGRALRSVMWPILISLLVSQLVVFADTMWCSGLGINALSAISYVSPIYWMLAGIGMGMGIGVAALVSRAIGKGDREEAGHYLVQGLAFMFILSLIIIFPIYLAAKPLMDFMGASSIMKDCMDYTLPLVILCPIIILNGVIIGGLRGEGDSRKTLEINIITAVANVIIDPLLIYGLGLGLTGAALSTAIASGISLALAFMWYFKGNTYVPLVLKGFRFSRTSLKELVKVGGPQVVEYDVMYMFNIFLLYYVGIIGGTTGVAVYNTPWRVIHIGVAPAEAIGSAIVPVASAAFGQGLTSKAMETYRKGTIYAVAVGITIAVVIAIAAEPILWMFTYSGDMAAYRHEMVDVLRIYCTFLPFFGLCFVGAGIVQSMKKGYISLVNALIRNFFLVGTYAWACTVSMTAIYWCTSFSEIVGGVLAIACAFILIRRIAQGKATAS